MNGTRTTAMPRAALAVGAAFLVTHAIGIAVAPRETTPACAICIEYKVDPNTAPREDLMLLPGIGPGLAQRIVEFRAAAATQPAFLRAEDLDAVERIGPAAVERLRPHLVFPAGAAERP